MAINFTRLFRSLGKLVGSLNSANTYRGTTLPARVAVLDAEYISPNQALIGELYTQEDSAKGSLDQWVDYLNTLATDTLIREVNLDRPMVSPSITEALSRVAQGLRDAIPPQTVTESPISLAQVSGLTVGNGALVFDTGVNDPSNGLADSYVIRCTSDQTTGALAYSEIFSVQGKANVGPLDATWPTGSNVDSIIQATDPANDTLVPSDPATWTASGTVSGNPANPRGGSTGTRTLTNAGTYIQTATGALAPGAYAWHVFLKGSGANAGGSVANITIVDSSGGLVTSLGSFNAVANTSWTRVSGVWDFTINPPFTPSAQYFLKITLSSGGAVVVDVAYLALQQLFPMYPGGPSMMIWSGTSAFGLADYWTASATRGGSETTSLYRGLERFFGVSSLAPQIQIPTGSPGTYTDALVV